MKTEEINQNNFSEYLRLINQGEEVDQLEANPDFWEKI